LTNLGDYRDEIWAELSRKPKSYPTMADTDFIIAKGLFTCGVGGKGWIGLKQVCRECIDGGAGRPDYCSSN